MVQRQTLYGQPAVYNATPPTLVDGNSSALNVDINGNLKTAGTATVSGTVAATQSGTWNVGASSATGAAVPANAFYIAGINASGNLVGLASIDRIGDTATGSAALATGQLIYNGTNYDRKRSIIAGTNSTGTGIGAVGLVAQLDDVAPTAVSENQFGNVRMNSVRALYNEAGPYSYGRATADTQIKSGAGFIHTVSIAGLTATPTAGLMTIYDSLTETGTVVYAEWVFATVEGHTVILDVPVTTGIYVGFDAALANAQVTVSYR